MTMQSVSRRAFVCGALSTIALPAQARDTLRLAAIDWAMLETAIALGVMPIAACELVRYRADAVRPMIPAETVDLGLRGSPNFELLQLVEPDLILSSPFYAHIGHRLSAISDVFAVPFYVSGEAPWPKALAALHALGSRLAMTHAARVAEERAIDEIEMLRTRLEPFRDRPCYVIQLGDARHFRAFGSDSMVGAVLRHLGLEHAWLGRSAFAFAAPVPLEKLAERPEARIVAVSGVPVAARQGLASSVLWNRLEPVAAGRLAVLDKVNPFGGVLAGLRFGRLLSDALTGSRA